MGIADSEMYKNLEGLFRKYKDFAFRIISNIPYGAVPAWKAFADGKVEEALKEDRGVLQSLKDFYVITVLKCIGSIIGFWYLFAIIGALFGGIVMILVTLAAAIDPVLTIEIIAAIAVLMLLAPAIMLLLQGLLVHALSKIAGGAGSFRQTLSVIVTGAGAGLILMVPMYAAYALIVGFFISPLAYAVYIFILYLQYKGIMHVHKLSPKRAAAVVLGSIAIVLLIYSVFVFVLEIIRFALESIGG